MPQPKKRSKNGKINGSLGLASHVKAALLRCAPRYEVFFLRPSDDVCCIAVSSDNHTCVTSTDVNNHATLGFVCGAQVPKCEPAYALHRAEMCGAHVARGPTCRVRHCVDARVH